MVVEYMDRAQGPTVDFFTQNHPGTYTRPANSLSESYGGWWPSADARVTVRLNRMADFADVSRAIMGVLMLLSLIHI